MFWELIATILSGFMAAGVALSLRLVIKKLPRWIVPAAAGLGMLGFQIFSEYIWFDHTKSRLPKNAFVVATHSEPAFYKPWSYLKAPTFKFVVAEKPSHEMNQSIKKVNLYFFERRMATQHTQILVDCENGVQSDFSQNPNWGKVVMTDDIVKVACD
ncbi:MULTISPECIES: hypothetical protein [unclassified Moraxella]|uniref:hypothetical protein n=1 Tax=unclassified Moraxella TaxID=2685852 RepID=UPI002B416D0B|nr:MULTISPECIES: hypothetical protein [unclassified Moraxella]